MKILLNVRLVLAVAIAALIGCSGSSYDNNPYNNPTPAVPTIQLAQVLRNGQAITNGRLYLGGAYRIEHATSPPPATFAATNTFTIQFSNAAGSFATPINWLNIANASSYPTGTAVQNTLVPSFVAGTAYRIRVVASNPAATSNELGPFNVFRLSIASLSATIGGVAYTFPNRPFAGAPASGLSVFSWRSSAGPSASDSMFINLVFPIGNDPVTGNVNVTNGNITLYFGATAVGYNVNTCTADITSVANTYDVSGTFTGTFDKAVAGNPGPSSITVTAGSFNIDQSTAF